MDSKTELNLCKWTFNWREYNERVCKSLLDVYIFVTR